jgi:hypothetical protein
MIVINSHVFAIEPKDSPLYDFMSRDTVNLFTREILDGKESVYGISLDTAEWAYKGIAVWVCPD